MSLVTVQCFVRGRVQGVSFRLHTRQAAAQIGVTGWVRNLPDGRVEILATGEQERVDRLLDWLPKGVPAGRVDALVTERVDTEKFGHFSILPDAELAEA